MEVTLREVIEAARQRSAPLTAEVAGYLTLLVTEQLNASPLRVGADEIALNAVGDLLLSGGHPAAAYEIEADLRHLLTQLLALCQSSTPALKKASARAATGDLQTLHAELFAALIPINHAASRRALGRLCRETYRARGLASEVNAGAAIAAVSEPAVVEIPESLLVEQEGAAAAPDCVPLSSVLPDTEHAGDELAGPATEALSLAAFAVDPSVAIDPLQELAPTLPPEAAAFVSGAAEDAGLDIDVQFLSDEEARYDAPGESEPRATEPAETDPQLEEGRRTEPGLAPLSWPVPMAAPAPLEMPLLADRPLEAPMSDRVEVVTPGSHRSDLSQLIANFLADSASDERIITELRRMIGLDVEAERAGGRARAVGG